MLGGTGSVLGGCGWYLVVLVSNGRYWLVFGGWFGWYGLKPSNYSIFGEGKSVYGQKNGHTDRQTEFFLDIGIENIFKPKLGQTWTHISWGVQAIPMRAESTLCLTKSSCHLSQQSDFNGLTSLSPSSFVHTCSVPLQSTFYTSLAQCLSQNTKTTTRSLCMASLHFLPLHFTVVFTCFSWLYKTQPL